uniref:Low-density lipoprotein receptor-related protein 1B-like n=1 Tax=Saccoglossus kowalevskii TaxID=10224 RepID=A0ABM0MFH4_SACKO|nr:PREDICTED: low-density lipoprotein receptor-related protein 1B-like [Saccoglossus kowalevskii]
MKNICNSNWEYTLPSYGDRLISQEEDTYDPNVDCNITLITYPPYDKFNIDFEYIYLEAANAGCHDYLNLYDGDVISNETLIEQVSENITCGDTSFYCAYNDWCIQNKLVCDGINNCGDAADEESCDTSSTNWVVIVVVLLVVILALCIGVCGLFMWIHRYFFKKSTKNTPSNINLTDIATE